MISSVLAVSNARVFFSYNNCSTSQVKHVNNLNFNGKGDSFGYKDDYDSDLPFSDKPVIAKSLKGTRDGNLLDYKYPF